MNDAGNCIVQGNEAATQWGAINDNARRYKQQWRISFTGASLAQVFLLAQWLDSFRLKISAELEYDDMGGGYRGVNLTVTGATPLKGAAVPADLLEEDGTYCDDEGCLWVEQVLEENTAEIYSAFVGEESYDDVEFNIQRSAIARMLASGKPIDGIEAFKALIPKSAWLLNL